MNEVQKPNEESGKTDSEGGELILGRFKTQEDLEKSYRELEASFTQKSQEAAQHRQALETLQAQQTSQLPASLPEEEEDTDQLFFREPAKATEKVVRQVVGPVLDFLYEQQKEKLRSDPEFEKYEREVDQLISLQPHMRLQPGIVAQVFKMVKGLHFDPEAFRAQVLEQHREKGKQKVTTGLESSDAPRLPGEGEEKDPVLSDEEKRIALKLYNHLSPADALKKYAIGKMKCGL